MLTPSQEKYLGTLSEDATVNVAPFNPLAVTIVKELTEKIKVALPTVEVRHIGATALGLSGKGDIDLDILCGREEFGECLRVLEKIFGETAHKDDLSVRWFFPYRGFPIELYLSDPSVPGTREEILIFEKLRDNPALKTEYEKFKASGNGLSAREYQRRKFEWYNTVLGINVDL